MLHPFQVFPEAPERRLSAAPALSLEPHREAPVGAVDPVTALSDKTMLLPRREGSVEFPQTLHVRWDPQMFPRQLLDYFR
jgi:hypothetical protein